MVLCSSGIASLLDVEFVRGRMWSFQTLSKKLEKHVTLQTSTVRGYSLKDFGTSRYHVSFGGPFLPKRSWQRVSSRRNKSKNMLARMTYKERYNTSQNLFWLSVKTASVVGNLNSANEEENTFNVVGRIIRSGIQIKRKDRNSPCELMKNSQLWRCLPSQS